MYRDQIRAQYAQFSPGYRRIADYILNNYQDAAFMTAARIAQSVQVDTALVVRFAQRLGYPGFPELIADVQAEVKQDLRAIYQPVDGDDSPAQVFRRNLLQDRNNLDYMLQHLDERTLEEVVSRFGQASRIFVSGEGNVSYFAEAFATRLLVLGYSAHTISPEVAGQASILAGLRLSDLVVGIGMTAMNPGVAAVIRQAREAGVHTVGIVSALTHPVAGVAEHVIHAPVHTVGIMPSWAAMASVLHALTQALALGAGDLAAEWAMRTDHFLTIYERVLKSDLKGVRASIAEYGAASRAVS